MVSIVHDTNSGLVIRGLSAEEAPKIISNTQIDRVITSDTNTQVIIDDAVYDRHTDATTVSDFNLVVESNETPIYTSTNSSVATVDVNGYITYISDGTTTIYIDCIQQGKLGVELTLNTSGGQTTDVLVGWAEGSLADEVNSNVDNAIAGTDASLAKNIFSSQDHDNGIYSRNTSNWAYQWVQEMTCISPWNSAGVHTRAGTLITRRHIIHAAHYSLSTGHVMRFVDVNNVVHERTIVGAKSHPDYSPHYPDIRIAVLDSDLPASISHCKMAPSTLDDYFTFTTTRHPCLLLDKEEKALIADLNYINTRIGFKYPTDPKRLEYSETIIGGDSGNPSFIIIDDELVLLSVRTYGGAGAGTFVGGQIDAINQLIVDVDVIAGDSTGYTVELKDLSGYTPITV